MTSGICIVGGGPAGLAAAIALKQSGRVVTVLDCAVPPIDKACGEGLMPDSLRALGNLGIEISESAPAIRGLRFFSERAMVSANFPDGSGRGLRRVLLHNALLARARELGVHLLWGVKELRTRKGRVDFAGGVIHTDLIVGADGQNSAIRRQAGLEAIVREKRRYGFRRHYGMPPWSPFIEVFWGANFQIYVTPVAVDQVCVALLSKSPALRLDAALALLPALRDRLARASPVTPDRGALSVSRRLHRVHTDGYVLLGDAAGSVDAITGEGLCLAFQQAAALVRALDSGDLRIYQREHRKIIAKPRQMAGLLLLLDTYPTLRRTAISVMSAHPRIFSSLLTAHVGHQPLAHAISRQLVALGLEAFSA